MNNYRSCGYSMQQAASGNACCSCPQQSNDLSALPSDPVAAMAYVPFQEDSSVYPTNQALLVGTIFPVLNKPFTGVNAGCAKT